MTPNTLHPGPTQGLIEERESTTLNAYLAPYPRLTREAGTRNTARKRHPTRDGKPAPPPVSSPLLSRDEVEKLLSVLEALDHQIRALIAELPSLLLKQFDALFKESNLLVEDHDLLTSCHSISFLVGYEHKLGEWAVLPVVVHVS